jgi:hypothetical protein
MSNQTNDDQHDKKKYINQDSINKDIFDYFIKSYLEVFFNECVDYLDFSKKNSLNTEFQIPNLSVDPKNPEKRSVDLLIEIPFKEGYSYDQFLKIYHQEDDQNPTHTEIKDLHLFFPNIPKDIKFLIHLELERNSSSEKMAYRMKEYSDLITLKYPNAFVLPIVVFFEASLGKIAWSKTKIKIFSQEIESFRYLRVGLKLEKAEDWLKSNHPAMKALAIHMKRNRKQTYVNFLKDVLVSIYSEKIDSLEKDFLMDYVIKSTTLTMSPDEKTKFQLALNKEPVMHTYSLESMKNYFEGKIEGKIEEKAQSILKILEYRKISYLPQQKQQLLAIQDISKLDLMFDLALTVDSMEALLSSSHDDK